MVPRTLPLYATIALTACTAHTNPLDEFEPVEATKVVEAPAPTGNANSAIGDAKHGQYLVELLGCGACHTDGALIGQPNSKRLLAGSRIGLAHSNPLQVKHPGVVFPSNLTPDPETGIGGMSDEAVARAIRGGVGLHGQGNLKVMPVLALSRISDDDIADVVAYFRSIPAVNHRVPDAVPENKKTDKLYVHFGVYRNRPD